MKLRYLVHLNSSSESPQHQPLPINIALQVISGQPPKGRSTWAEHVLQKNLKPAELKTGSVKQSVHSSSASFPHRMHSWGPGTPDTKVTPCLCSTVSLPGSEAYLQTEGLWCRAPERERSSQTSWTSCQSGASGGWGTTAPATSRAQSVGQRRQHHLQEDRLPSLMIYDCHRFSHDQWLINAFTGDLLLGTIKR